MQKNTTTTQHGAIEGKTQTHEVDFYNLDMIISVGYRVHSYRGVQFRMWATRVLKEYIVNHGDGSLTHFGGLELERCVTLIRAFDSDIRYQF